MATHFTFIDPPLKGCTLKINLSEFESTMDLISDCVKKTHILLYNLNLEYLCEFLQQNQFYLKNTITDIKRVPEQVHYIHTLELP